MRNHCDDGIGWRILSSLHRSRDGARMKQKARGAWRKRGAYRLSLFAVERDHLSASERLRIRRGFKASAQNAKARSFLYLCYENLPKLFVGFNDEEMIWRLQLKQLLDARLNLAQ